MRARAHSPPAAHPPAPPRAGDAAQYLRIETAPRDGGVALVQDLPVRVAGSAEMLRFTPPKLPPPNAVIFLPAPRTVVRRAARAALPARRPARRFD